MRHPEEELIEILKGARVDFTASLPCEKIKLLLEMVGETFFHMPLTREEEGVGICAGAALAGRRPAVFVQSSGIGNMINALLSLTGFYELPLAIFVSRRGIYREKIAAQLPMGQRLPGILKGAGISHSLINTQDDLKGIGRKLESVYRNNTVHAFLLSPEIWEGSAGSRVIEKPRHPVRSRSLKYVTGRSAPQFTRYAILKIIAPYLQARIVVCNLGFPSKELYEIRHQPSNFYMLGSMGMVTPIGLGISVSTDREVVVIDGDGSLLMNPGALATAAHLGPKNLTIIAVDNAAYGSTGNQDTLTGSCVDLEILAKGFGIRHTAKAATERQLIDAMKKRPKGLRFIHALAVSGNKDVPNIDIPHLEIKRQFQEFMVR
ncbi:MAG: sulfopyruvate decarboxylase subunit beta [Nitrospirae bacterium]|nr:sulfopyruvate decarboxylase subunit beta [Nitrospirota bacterium]